MKPKIALVYTREHNESIVEKNRLKKENPNAVIIETSNSKNKKALKEILEDDNYKVISCHKSLNARVASSEKARIEAREERLAKQKAELEKKASKKDAPKKTPAKKAAKKKPAKKTVAKKTTTKKPAAKKAAKGKGKATSKK